ncbi:hypothetical protein J437_LFUL014037 [Ladona fulva]|uniref:aspartate carbamoyltransferase n=1 Tax=Ladona fulva TaxID=123851 RepID=A0A8K0KNX9_LADFU|nr:hypothetical protein J437_LFUL014037 [Ladona fulva]
MRIFGLPHQPDTYIEVEMGREWKIPDNSFAMESSCNKMLNDSNMAQRLAHSSVSQAIVNGINGAGGSDEKSSNKILENGDKINGEINGSMADDSAQINPNLKSTVAEKKSSSVKVKNNGITVKGAVHRVVLRGEVAFVDGQVLIKPGFGKDVREMQNKGTAPPPAFLPAAPVIPQQQPVVDVAPMPLGWVIGTEPSGADIPRQGKDTLFRTDQGANRSVAVPSSSQMDMRDNRPQLPAPVSNQVQQQRCTSPIQPSPIVPYQPVSLGVSALTVPSASQPSALAGRHILSVDSFTKEQMNEVLNLASTMRVNVIRDRPLDHILKGKLMASIFYEASTRTSCSFAAAMLRLGGQVIHVDSISSSVTKGESLEDTVAVMAGYTDVVVLRHPEPGAVSRAASRCRKPVISGGDGVGEHPTQALLDAFAIREEIGTINGLTLALVGDLKHGRTVHSLARLLTLYNVRLLYVNPPGLGMPENIKEYVSSKGIPQEEYRSLEEVIPETDVIYMTRIQKERFQSVEEYEKACGVLILTPHLMRFAKQRCVVLHPLPRLNEISPELDSDPRAAYFRQAEGGLYVRMALLALVLGRC